MGENELDQNAPKRRKKIAISSEYVFVRQTGGRLSIEVHFDARQF